MLIEKCQKQKWLQMEPAKSETNSGKKSLAAERIDRWKIEAGLIALPIVSG